MAAKQYWIIIYFVIFGLTTACPSMCNCSTDNTGRMAVDCSKKSLTKVPTGIPANCDILNLGDNNFTNLFAYSFPNLTELSHLDLSGNNINCLHKKAFIDLSNLQTLLLNNNCITYNISCVPPGVFLPLKRLINLSIGQNSDVTDIRQEYPDEAIGDIPSLHHLGIDGLKNKSFGPGFKRLRSLRVLDMSGTFQRCHVDILYNLTFENFRSTPLREIHFEQCFISRIFPEAFHGLESLERLDLSHLDAGLPFDQLEPLSYGLKDTKINYLNLNYIFRYNANILTKKHMKHLQHTNLKKLYMDGNNIVWIEKEWINETLPRNLELLSLNYNFILGDPKALSTFTFERLNLKELHLSPIHDVQFQKPITYLPINLKVLVLTGVNSYGTAISSIQFTENSLTTFSLKDGSIAVFQGHIIGLTVIETLELSNLNCFNISYNYFALMPSLTSISLSVNYLGHILSQDEKGQLFGNQNYIRHLNLTRNSIAHLPARFFQGLLNIQTIDLSYNAIGDINVHLNNMTFLNILNLYSNQLLYLSNRVTTALEVIAENGNFSVDIGDNPLICDCSSHTFLIWLTRTKVNFLNQDRYSCFLNNHLAYFDDLETILLSLDQQCANHYIIITVCSFCIATSLTICIVKTCIKYKFHLHITYLYHAARRQYKSQNPHADKKFVFAAFLSFGESEWDVVKTKFMLTLEEDKGYRLCIHHRDFIPGTPIASNIANAIHSSKKTIVLLSQSFLESDWCKFELHMALMEHIYSGRQTIIIIKFPGIPAELMDLEIHSIMRYETVLDYFPAPEYEDVFWNRLARALDDVNL